MSDTEAVQAVIERWMACLDAGDLDGMLDTCHPDVILANDRQPTSVGAEHIRAKFAPRIEKFSMRSTFETEHIALYDDFAIVMGHYEVAATNTASGEVNTAKGRLALSYRRDAAGAWKMVLDMDNN